MRWYYTKNNSKQGPITESELHELAARDQLDPGDLVWHAGLSEWTRAEDIPGLLAPPPLESDVELPEPEETGTTHPLSSLPEHGGDDTVKRVEKKRSYIRKHWDGDLSLAQSFWINNFLINLIVLVAMAVVEGMPRLAEENPEGYAAGVLLFIIVFLPVTIWQWVGLFRCARRHIRLDISRGWANVAMVLLILGIIRTTMDLIRDYPVYRDLTNVVLNNVTTYDYDITLANNNMKTLLRTHPEIRTVHLNSHGGLIEEGRELAALIRENWLDTYTSQRCLSACTLAYVAGKQRFIKKGATLGFHQYVVFGSTGSTRQAEEGMDRDLMIKAGINADFLERAYSTPTLEQLVDAGVVTSVTEGTEFSKNKPTLASYTRADIAEELLTQPLYTVIKKKEPETFNEMVSIFEAKLKDGASLDAIVGLVLPLMQESMLNKLGYADDLTLLDFVDVMIDELQILNDKKPLLCMQNLFPQRFGRVAFAPYLPESVLARERRLMINVMESYDPQRAIPALTEDQESLLTVAALKALSVYPNVFEFLDNTEIPESDYKHACAGVVAMYESIEAFPPEDAVPILRFMFTQ
jgi:ATP-dependent protease ClpP protease subunit